MCSLSYVLGHYPAGRAMIHLSLSKTLLKKSTLDPYISNNYRPISNLPFLSKVLEKVVYQQLNHFLSTNNCLNTLQSGLCPHYSTGIALLKVIYDIHLNCDSGKISTLVLLDISTLNHMLCALNTRPETSVIQDDLA